MATRKQRAAARKNVKKAQAGAKSKQTLKHLPSSTRTALGVEAGKGGRGEGPTREGADAQGARAASPRAEHPRPLEDGQGRAQARGAARELISRRGRRAAPRPRG